MDSEKKLKIDYSFNHSFMLRKGPKKNALLSQPSKLKPVVLKKTLSEAESFTFLPVQEPHSSNTLPQDFYQKLFKLIPKDSKDYIDLVNGFKRLEETVISLESKNLELKIRVDELENENSYLGKRLKSAWKQSKSVKPDQIDENDQVGKLDFKYFPTSQSGKYLKSLSEKYLPGSKEFFKELESLLEYREHKLNVTIDHYKNIISSLNLKIKQKNSETCPSFSLTSLGRFFKECVEDSKKYIVDRKHINKFLTSDKMRIMEKFLLNEDVLKLIYGQLIQDKKTESKTDQKPLPIENL